jgi:hypothetical protein
LREDQDTKEDPKNWQVPKVDFLSNRHPVYIPGNDARKLVGVSYIVTKFAMTPESLWYNIRSQINPQAHGYHCSFHPEVFQGINFLGEREV